MFPSRDTYLNSIGFKYGMLSSILSSNLMNLSNSFLNLFNSIVKSILYLNSATLKKNIKVFMNNCKKNLASKNVSFI